MKTNKIRASAVVLAALAAMSSYPASSHAAIPSGAGSVRHTAVRPVRPVDGHGRLGRGYRLVSRVGGQRIATRRAVCNFGSQAVNVAYRCFAGNQILDPCWVAHDRGRVYCQPDPWQRRVVRLDVSHFSNSGYTRRGARRRVTTPWGVRTTAGRRALWVQGATCSTGVRGKRVSYDLGSRYSLVGSVQRRASPWRMQRVRRTTGVCRFRAAGHVRLADEWIGKPSRRGATP